MRDVNAIGVDLPGLGYCCSVLWPLRERWYAWRRIGAVALDIADLSIVPGKLSPCDVVITPRRDAALKEIRVVLDYRESRSMVVGSAWQVDVPSADPMLRAGIPAIFKAEFVLPPVFHRLSSTAVALGSGRSRASSYSPTVHVGNVSIR